MFLLIFEVVGRGFERWIKKEIRNHSVGFMEQCTGRANIPGFTLKFLFFVCWRKDVAKGTESFTPYSYG